jgi:DNA topoisomerase I
VGRRALGALTNQAGRKKWWTQAWRVALIAAVALPVVTPAAAVIAISFLVFNVIDCGLDPARGSSLDPGKAKPPGQEGQPAHPPLEALDLRRLPWLLMSLEASPLAAAVPGLVRIDPHGPGITRVRDADGVRYLDLAGAEITDTATLGRIRALRIPPAWADVWISPDPAGHIQATGTDSKGRLQYLYHRLWREQRDAQKFGHMLRFADALPRLRTAATADLRHPGLTRDRVVASVVRLIDLGMFRIGGERYAELDHHYGATTLQKHHVRVTRDGIMFDYTAKWGKQRTIVIRDSLVQPTIRALARVDNDLEPLWCYEQDGSWHILHSRDVGNYIAARAGGHFTAKEFRTWNATVLMALALTNAGPSSTLPGRQRTIAASVREVASWLGDTPAVARGSYIDPRLIARYEADGQLPAVPQAPVALPATSEAEIAVAALLAAGGDNASGRGTGVSSG